MGKPVGIGAGELEAAAGFEPANDGFANRLPSHPTEAPVRTSDKAENVLPSCLPDSTHNDPDLAAVVKAWPDLPEAVKAGILAMVKASQ